MAVLLVAAVVVGSRLTGDRGAASVPEPSSPVAVPPVQVDGRSPVPPWMSLPEPAEPCPPATVRVGDGEQLQEALDGAGPGTVIHLDDGVHRGQFTVGAPADPRSPAWLCGGPGAVLDGGGLEQGYVLHLEGADHWTVQGFTVRHGQKGVMADGVDGTTFAGLTIHSIGEEGLHLRRHSSDNLVVGSVISDTGLRTPEYGEGLYVGSAQSNWCDLTDCEPDRSDRNRLVDNVVFATTAEPIDIKEGTTAGSVVGNQLDGSATTGPVPDSWVAVKGNHWLLSANTGRYSPLDGYQVTEVADGWGRDNVLSHNTGLLTDPDGVLVALQAAGNTDHCTNRLLGTGGLARTGPCVR